jgi:hypothetical protein
MDRIFIAVTVSSILVLITAAGLLVALSREILTPEAPTITIGQRRH